jgi:hypothetical protein
LSSLRSCFRWTLENSDLALAAVLALIGALLVRDLDTEEPDKAIVFATLAGALFGGVAVLLGNWITRRNERAKSAQERAERYAKLTTVIAAELADVACALIGAAGLTEAAVIQLRSTSGTVSLDLTMHMPRDMPFTLGFISDLYVFDQAAIDALVTLFSNLEITRREINRVASLPGGAWRSNAIAMANGLCDTMEILAQCYERIAPTRKLTLPGRAPEVGSKALRDCAAELNAAATT